MIYANQSIIFLIVKVLGCTYFFKVWSFTFSKISCCSINKFFKLSCLINLHINLHIVSIQILEKLFLIKSLRGLQIRKFCSDNSVVKKHVGICIIYIIKRFHFIVTHYRLERGNCCLIFKHYIHFLDCVCKYH